MRVKLLMPGLLLTGVLSANLSALPLSGVFNIAGSITVNANSSITWNSVDSPFPADKATIGPGPTGSFSGLGGSALTIKDLTNPPDVVGSPGFTATPFMSFDTAPLLSGLNINFIFPGFYNASGCTASPAAQNQSCTPNPPITASTSPFNFVNNPGSLGPQATATFVFSGITADGLSAWSANFTSQFNVPFQTVLAQLGTQGFVSNTYSATVTVVPLTTTPEPGSPALMSIGLGLVVLSLQLRRRKV
jgi:hypothetical protein